MTKPKSRPRVSGPSDRGQAPTSRRRTAQASSLRVHYQSRPHRNRADVCGRNGCCSRCRNSRAVTFGAELSRRHRPQKPRSKSRVRVRRQGWRREAMQKSRNALRRYQQPADRLNWILASTPNSATRRARRPTDHHDRALTRYRNRKRLKVICRLFAYPLLTNSYLRLYSTK
jgi:hypothetical protein